MIKIIHDENISLKEILYKNSLNFYPIIDVENVTIINKKDENFIIKILLTEIQKTSIQDIINYFKSLNKNTKNVNSYDYHYVCFIYKDEEIYNMSLTEYLSFAEKEETNIYDNCWEIFEMIEEEQYEQISKEIEKIPSELDNTLNHYK